MRAAVYAGGAHGEIANYLAPPPPGREHPRRYLRALVEGVEGLPVDVHLAASIPRSQQMSYRWILDVDGQVRTWGAWAWKMASGSTVLSPASPWESFFTREFEPWVHFVPVANDFADLAERLAWCRDHDDECRRIAEAARLRAAEVYEPGRVAAEVARGFRERLAQYCDASLMPAGPAEAGPTGRIDRGSGVDLPAPRRDNLHVPATAPSAAPAASPMIATAIRTLAFALAWTATLAFAQVADAASGTTTGDKAASAPAAPAPAGTPASDAKGAPAPAGSPVSDAKGAPAPAGAPATDAIDATAASAAFGPADPTDDDATLTVLNRPVVVFRAPFLGVAPKDRVDAARERLRTLFSRGGEGKVSLVIGEIGVAVLVDSQLAFVVSEADARPVPGATMRSIAEDAAKVLAQIDGRRARRATRSS
ncbi:MAG: hypothetical protein IPF73_13735 [Betaproteobacteria bacterium]|nr:hypothetical protein [Betaproteobacteria bacterium]